MTNLNELVEEMRPIMEWLDIDTGDKDEIFGIADAFAWFPIWDGGNGDKYDMALCWMKDWGERVIEYLSTSSSDGGHDYADRALGSKVDPLGPDLQPIPELPTSPGSPPTAVTTTPAAATSSGGCSTTPASRPPSSPPKTTHGCPSTASA